MRAFFHSGEMLRETGLTEAERLADAAANTTTLPQGGHSARKIAKSSSRVIPHRGMPNARLGRAPPMGSAFANEKSIKWETAFLQRQRKSPAS
jgi:hypothetical protein